MTRRTDTPPSADSPPWSPDIAGRERPLYLAIADALGEDIAAGRLPTGQRLPPQRALAERLGLDFTTVSRAYAEAARRGLVDARVGQGTFVRAPSMAPPAPAPAPLPTGVVDMSMNQPPVPTDPALALRVRRSLDDATERAGLAGWLRYPDAGAFAAEAEAGCRWLLPRLPEASPERLVVCPGTQGALLALLATLTRPGDTVCTEALTYPGFRAVAAQLGLRVVGVAMDAEGLEPEALRAVCAAHGPKALYCTPTLHNPTTATMGEDRRRAVAAVAREAGVAIIEDDIYGLLPDRAAAPIAALAPDITHHIAGLAKCVSPALRIAYVTAPDARQARHLTAALRATSLMPSPVMAAVAGAWIDDGTAEALRRAIHAEGVARRAMALAALPAPLVTAAADAYHLWLAMPEAWTRADMAGYLRTRGITVAVSDTFATTPQPPEALRLCLGAPGGREEVARVLGILADALAQPPALAALVI